jgi:hypothetical protein
MKAISGKNLEEPRLIESILPLTKIQGSEKPQVKSKNLAGRFYQETCHFACHFTRFLKVLYVYLFNEILM